MLAILPPRGSGVPGDLSGPSLHNALAAIIPHSVERQQQWSSNDNRDNDFSEQINKRVRLSGQAIYEANLVLSVLSSRFPYSERASDSINANLISLP